MGNGYNIGIIISQSMILVSWLHVFFVQLSLKWVMNQCRESAALQEAAPPHKTNITHLKDIILWMEETLHQLI